MKKQIVVRGAIYTIGLLVLALGIILNSKTDLGVSPIISVAYSASNIWNLNFGNMTFLLYSSFVLFEVIVHVIKKEKRRVLLDLLQIPLSLVFTRFMNLFGYFIPDFATDLQGTWFAGYVARILFLILAIVLTGIGVAMSVNMRLIPNPGDGIVQTISDITGMSMGLTKNVFDCGCIVCTCIFGLALRGKLIGIGIGTILSMIGVGRTIAVCNLFFMMKMLRVAGIKYEPDAITKEQK